MKIKTIGIVGTGFIADDFIKKLNPNIAKVIAVFGINQIQAKKFARKHGIACTQSLEELMQKSEVDMIYVGVPNQAHYEVMIAALSYKKHILCEKVFTLNSKQLQHIEELAKNNNCVVIEGMTLFYMPLFHLVKKYIQEGYLGDITMLSISFGSCKEANPANRFFSLEKGGGALFDIGTYALSAALMLMRTSPRLLQTSVKKFKTGVDDTSGIILQNDDKEMAVISLSFRGKLPKQVIVSGSLGYIVISDFPRATKAMVFHNDGNCKKLSVGNDQMVYDYEVQYMQDILQNKQTFCSFALTKKVIELMDDIRKLWGLSYPGEDE